MENKKTCRVATSNADKMEGMDAVSKLGQTTVNISKELLSLNSLTDKHLANPKKPGEIPNPKKIYESIRFGRFGIWDIKVSGAIIQLRDACEFISTMTGLYSSESAEAYYYYGKTLLYEARLDMTKSLDMEDIDSSMKINDTGYKSGDNSGNADADNPEGHSKASTSDFEVKDKNAPKPYKSCSEIETIANEDKTGTILGPDVRPQEENFPSLVLASKALQISRDGYNRLIVETKNELSKNTELDTNRSEQKEILKTYKTRLAYVHSMLGEVATELEDYHQAVNEIEVSLAICREIFESNDREIAQCHFQLGVVYSLDKKFQEAIQSFKTSLELIQNRMDGLEQMLAARAYESSSKKMIKTELNDLRAVFPDIQQKIEHLEDAEEDDIDGNELEEETENVSNLEKRKRRNEHDFMEVPLVNADCNEAVATSKKSKKDLP